jgi:hypothetical protein
VLEKVRRGPEADDPPPAGSPTVPAVDAGRIRDNQSIPDDAETPVRYNSNLYDTAGIHPETFDGESRFTAPIDGLYLIRASVRWAAGGPGTRELILRRNGGGNHATHRFDPDDLGLPRMHSIERTQLLRAGDFVEAVVKQTSGDALEVALGVDTEFQMHWLAPAPPE